MKPLLQTKITRDRKAIGDYIPAKDQDTVEGLQDFAERQRKRIADAALRGHTALQNIRNIKRKGEA